MTAPLAVDRESLHRTIAVVNAKGGVGKTSTVANLAGLLAEAGYGVLAIDLDPQGNLGSDLGYLNRGLSDGGAELQNAVMAGRAPQPIKAVRQGLDVIAGGERLHDLTAVLLSQRQRGLGVESLVASISAIASEYDVVIIDCPPGSDILQAAALETARWVVIPTKTDDASRAGLREVARRFTSARETNPDVSLLGVFLWGVNTAGRRLMRDARESLAADLGSEDLLLNSTIRHVEAAAVDARGRGQLVHELERDVLAQPAWYEARKTGTRPERLAASAKSLAGDYQSLAEEIVKRMAAAETQHPEEMTS